jgi:hypothetical protein
MERQQVYVKTIAGSLNDVSREEVLDTFARCGKVRPLVLSCPPVTWLTPSLAAQVLDVYRPPHQPYFFVEFDTDEVILSRAPTHHLDLTRLLTGPGSLESYQVAPSGTSPVR